MDFKKLNKISDVIWEIPKDYRDDMRVPARIYADEKMLKDIQRDHSLEQLTNVCTLPGIEKWALAMPDVHEGYGFPVGGVAAFNLEEGIISPGGIGYDINCGVRLLLSSFKKDEISSYLDKLAKKIFIEVPSGVGRGGNLVLHGRDFDSVLLGGARKMVEMGYGKEEDLNNLESNGVLEGADPDNVSREAKSRGRDQLGTIGAGNHFVEVDYIEKIFPEAEKETREFGLFEGRIVILIHTGSRGLGHQVATDYIRLMNKMMSFYKINLPDRELACAPFSSKDGKNYFSAMKAAANFAWANRQLITFEVQKVFKDVFGSNSELSVFYDVAHNIAKIEEYDGKNFLVHRKGATRAFPSQPVLIPGSMGTSSYVLVGQEASLSLSFGSTCHGAGRRMSRTQAKREFNLQNLYREFEEKKIIVNAGSRDGILEEAPYAYKDVDEVVDIINRTGIAKKVARLKPLAVIKG